MKKSMMILAVLLGTVWVGHAQIERAEPGNWWTGMTTPLQVMFKGDGIGTATVRVMEKGLKVKAVHRAESPNYLFVDVEVAKNAKAGEYTFEFTIGERKFTHPYPIAHRREGSSERKSFTSADVVYLIMPDRFANGNPSNDNTDDTAEKIRRDFFHGRHGGDIQGVIDHLDYIADLGVTAIWSTPWTLDNEPGFSYHGYACADYYKIDPRFGSNELYARMVAEGHKRGVKTIMDVVTNHCGTAHWWMADLPFADWVNPQGEANHAMSVPMDPNRSEFDRGRFHRSWFARSMPDMNMANPFVFNYFRQWAVWWIEQMNLDGFRVDTFPYNDKAAMAEWVASVLAEYPDFSIVGESWLPISAQIAYWVGGNSNRDGYDSHLPMGMDFPLMNALHGALRSGERGRRGDIHGVYNSVAQDFVYEDPAHDLMIFLDNHDTEHIADVVDGNVDKMKIALTLMATLRGMPQIWVGTEVMFRSQDLRQGHGSARRDFPGGWPGDERNLFTAEGRNEGEQAVWEHARKMLNWRKTKSVIHNGRTVQFAPRDGLWVFFRCDDADLVMTAVNLSAKPAAIDWAWLAEIAKSGATGRDIVSGAAVTVGQEFTLPPNGSAVVEF